MIRYRLQQIRLPDKRFGENYDKEQILHEFGEQNLTGMLENFKQFLSGCGFIVSGDLQFVDYDEEQCDRSELD